MVSVSKDANVASTSEDVCGGRSICGVYFLGDSVVKDLATE